MAAAAPNRISIGGAGTLCPPLVDEDDDVEDEDEDEDDDELDDEDEDVLLEPPDDPDVAPLEVAPPELAVSEDPRDEGEEGA